MRYSSKWIPMLVLVLLVFSPGARFFSSEGIEKSFSGSETVRIGTVRGDLVVRESTDGQIGIRIENSYQPGSIFEVDINEYDGLLQIDELLKGRVRGKSVWTLSVPRGTRIEFQSRSGDLYMKGLSGEFYAMTGSGDIRVEGCHGLFGMSTGSGDYRVSDCGGKLILSAASGSIDLKECRAGFDLSTMSGDIEASGVILEEKSGFSASTGRVKVVLGETPEYDLNIDSDSGKAILDYRTNAVKGRISVTAGGHDGEIESPLDFDEEKIFHRQGRRFVKKSLTRGSMTPSISVETSSGTAVLMKDQPRAPRLRIP